jgi:hypothetical protein
MTSRYTQRKECRQCGKEFGRYDLATPGNFPRMKYCGWDCAQAAKAFSPEKAREQFWTKVDKNGPDGCWLWIGAKHKRGYGACGAKAYGDCRAHRVAWRYLRGEIPDDKELCHRCDNKLCVNPDHIFLGTHHENMLDAKAKKRHTFGVKNPRAMLDDEKALRILELKEQGYRRRGVAKSLADEHGVGVGAIHAIWRGASWKHLQS